DTLFQLGMDLTRSSTAQEEDRRVAASVAHEDRKDYFVERDGKRFAGTHLIVDLFGARRLDDLEHTRRTLRRFVEVAGVAVLSESHISIHSWPEADYAALDIFMCGSAEPQKCVEVLREAFSVRDVVVKTHHRGFELDELKWRAASVRQAPVRLKSVKKARRAA
ncbi:MAG: S-adenosylmethionine decarboxylase, partial [Hyphomicrobium sp.]